MRGRLPGKVLRRSSLLVTPQALSERVRSREASQTSNFKSDWHTTRYGWRVSFTPGSWASVGSRSAGREPYQELYGKNFLKKIKLGFK